MPVRRRALPPRRDREESYWQVHRDNPGYQLFLMGVMMHSYTYDQALDHIGFGRFQRRLLWYCGFGWAADGMEVLLVSFALPSMAAEWSLSSGQQGLLATAIFIGMFLGGTIWGRLADRVGRKIGFMATIGIDSLFGLLSAFAPSFSWFLVLRMLTGFGVGGTLPVDYGMFSEYLPTEKRGRWLVILESFWALGTITAAGLAWLVIPRFGWRVLFVLSAVPGIFMLLMRRTVPESPRFKLAGGRTEEARKILAEVARVNGTQLPEGKLEGIASPRPSRAKDLFAPHLRRTTLLLWFIWFAISVGYYGAFTWLPSWFRAKGFPLPSVYPYIFLTSIAQLPGYFSAALLVDRLGRKKTLGLYLAASGMCVWIFARSATPAAILVSTVFLCFFALGAWGALYAYTPEAYPTTIRATGIGTASSMTRLAGIVAPLVGSLASGTVFSLPLAVFALAYLLGSIAAFILPHETMSRKLEDTV